MSDLVPSPLASVAPSVLPAPAVLPPVQVAAPPRSPSPTSTPSSPPAQSPALSQSPSSSRSAPAPSVPASQTPPSGSPPSTPSNSPPSPSPPQNSTSPSTPTTNASPPPPPKSNSTPATSSSTPSPSSSSQISTAGLVGIGVAAVVAVAVIVILLICLTRRKKKRSRYTEQHYRPPGDPRRNKDHYYETQEKQQWNPSSDILVKMPPPPPAPPFPLSDSFGNPAKSSPSHPQPQIPGNSMPWFTYEELAAATDGFALSNLLGEGGFGCVYKGLLPGNRLVAVKQLKVGGSQGEREFQAEVETISRVHHRHLVSLVGYCISDSQRLLVYDYVPNRTLAYHLHGKGRPVMDWKTRLKIAVGAARGLAYLHEDCHPRIIHRDIKSSNILLDNNFEAKVSDFGLAKFTSDMNTHVTTRVMGTFGYLAPEYASSGKLTEKSDVFSFGVVLLELITGRKPVDTSQPLGDESLVEWARPVLTQVLEAGNFGLLVDPELNGHYDEREMMLMVEAAAACVRHSASKRPRMGQVVRALEDDIALSDLNKGVKPGQSTIYDSTYESTDYDSSQYSADIKRFRKIAIGSSEYGSEFSGATSERGVNPSVSSGEDQTSREATGWPRSTKPKSHQNIASSSSSSKEYPSNQEIGGH